MAEKKVNRLAGLVKGASSDLAPEEPIRRGRGLEGMIAEGPVLGAPAALQGDMSTSQQVDNLASGQVSTPPSTRAEAIARTVKSYRIRDDLAYRIDVLAAQERRKIYEVVEEALDLYLRARAEAQGTQL